MNWAQAQPVGLHVSHLQVLNKECEARYKLIMWGYAPHTRGYFPFTMKVTKVVSKGTPLRHPLGYAPQWSIDHAPPLPQQRVQPEASDLRESEAFRFELNRQRELRAGSACKEKRWCSE